MKYFFVFLIITAVIVIIYLILKSNKQKQDAINQQAEFTSILNSNQNQINSLTHSSSIFSSFLASLALL